MQRWGGEGGRRVRGCAQEGRNFAGDERREGRVRGAKIVGSSAYLVIFHESHTIKLWALRKGNRRG